MEKTALITAAEELVLEFGSLLNGMKDISEKVPQIEIDLAKGKILMIYDLLLELELNNPQVKEPFIEKSLPEEEEVKEIKTQNIVNVQIHQMEEEIIERETEELPPEEDVSVQADLPPQNDLGSLDLFAEPSVISEVEMIQTVVDKIAEGKNEVSVADKMQKNKIQGLKSAIGINEKFFFINELFEGNMKDYNEAIDKLEDCESFDLAGDVLSSVSHERNWVTDSDAYIQLQGFVERKFK